MPDEQQASDPAFDPSNDLQTSSTLLGNTEYKRETLSVLFNHASRWGGGVIN